MPVSVNVQTVHPRKLAVGAAGSKNVEFGDLVTNLG